MGSTTTTLTTTSPADSTEFLKTQKQIVASLLRQQPTIVQAKVSGSPPPVEPQNILTFQSMSPDVTEALKGMKDFDLNNILNTINALTKTNAVTLKKSLPAVKFKPSVVQDDKDNPSSSTSPEVTLNTDKVKSEKTDKADKAAEVEYKPRNVREKVYADGYIMSFDKKSCCGLKDFWRCERKNDCAARIHVDMNTKEILRKLHPHNHNKPSPEELAFYEQDFSKLRPHYAHPVKSVSIFQINRSYMQRKLSKASQLITTSPLQEPLIEETKPVITDMMTQAAAAVAAAVSPQLMTGQKRAHSESPAPIKMKMSKTDIKAEEDDAITMMSSEEFRAIFELTKKIVEIVRPRNEICVKYQGKQDELLIFLAHEFAGVDEKLFYPVVVDRRDEKALKTALERFTKRRLQASGLIVLTYSDKVNVLVHQALISNWTHGKLFLINTETTNIWRLTPVDAYGRALNSM